MPLPINALPKINGQTYQHGNVAPVILSDGGRLPLDAFKSISYKDESKKKAVRNSQGARTGAFTLDNQDDGEASVEILMEEWVAIKKYLATTYPTIGIGQIVMDWNVSYGNVPSKIITDRLEGVMFQNNPRDSSDNQDALYVKLDLIITGQIIDGATGMPFIVYGQPGQ
jgi:hypothetical protein